MAAWMNLLRKEWILAQKFTVGGLLIMTVALLIGIGCSVYYPYGISSLLFFIGCITFLLLHVFIYLIVSFASERNSQTLWMQTPLPGWSLIAAKVAAAILSMVILMAAAFIMSAILLHFDGDPDFSSLLNDESLGLTEADRADLLTGEEILRYMNEHYFELLLVLIPLLVSGAALLGSIYLIYYFIYRWVRRWIGGWSVFAGMAAVTVILTVYDWIFQSRMIQWFEWGSVRVSDTALELNGTSFQIYLETMSLGQLLFNFILVGLVVFICGWILDRKVEV